MKRSRAALMLLAFALAISQPACSRMTIPPHAGATATASPQATLPAAQTDTPTPASTPDATEAPAPPTFTERIFVDGVALTGLTMDQARQQVEAAHLLIASRIGVTLKLGDETWKFTSADVSYSFATDEALARAWSDDQSLIVARRVVSPDILDRFPVEITTELQIDPTPLEQKVHEIAGAFYAPFTDSAFAGYDPTKPDGQRLLFTEAVPGRQIDFDTLWTQIKEQLFSRAFGTVEMNYIPVDPKITKQTWLTHMKLLSRFSSLQKDHTTARMTNVRVACAAVSGRIIQPDEVFSFNDATGPRTADKGYQVAHVINGGVIDNGLAGGTCQVSGTLFNAAARADLDIAERHAHSLKSSYLPLGQDATVDYGRYDLQIRNDTDSPMLIIMYVGSGKDQYRVFSEIYGMPREPGVTIDLLSQITETIPAPATVSYAPSDAVKLGTTEVVKPHEGWKLTTYRVYYRNGKELRRTVLHKDYYKEAGTIIVYNPADPKPTPLPSASPSPSATAKPN